MDLEIAVTDLAPRLLRYCLGHAGSAEAAEEAAQEALVALVARWRRHGPPDSPEAFAFAIASRRARRAAFRRGLMRPLAVLGSREGDEPGAEDGGPDPEARLEERILARDRLVHVRSALDRLRARDREALLLAAAGELDTAAAALVLGISRSAYKMRLHRARRRLAEILEEPDARIEEAPERARG